MTNFKELKTNLLQNNGYSHNWKLIKEKDISIKHKDEYNVVDFFDKITRQTTKPLCQNIDLIVPSKNRTQNQQIQLEQFLNIIGTELQPNVLKMNRHESNPHVAQDLLFNSEHREFERNDEKRQFRIQEFIKTEKSYVETLKTLVKFVVNPLRSNMQQKNCILNTFKCHKIFLNIDQIMSVNEKFLLDLLNSQGDDNFGLICEKHIINFECYRKYLLEQSEAQKLHAKEFKINQTYRRFLVKVKDQSEFKRKRLQDILVEPVQRISRYSMMLRDILQLTPEDHPDYRGLKTACEKAKEIATMADDDPTKTATMFLNLYQAIKDSPCSLINQKRSLVAHLDATEIHRVTNKPTRAVSLFLFTDKILVASRSSIDAKEIDLEELLENSSTTSPTSTSSASLLFPNKKVEKSHHGLKFKGWTDIESIELFDGVSDSASFILSASTVQETKRNEVSNITSFEKYFYKGPRLFSIIPQREEASMTRLKKAKYVEKANEFKALYQKARALAKQYESNDKTFYKEWKGVPTFCNVYSPENYIKAKYKNDSALIYVDDEDIDTDKLFSRSSSSFNPWIIGLIQPEDMKGFRFNICTKLNFPRHNSLYEKKSNEQTIDFESIFWNNLMYLDQSLKRSIEFTTQNMIKIQQAISGGGSHRSRSKSISRTTSIPSIGKLFHNNSNSSMDRINSRDSSRSRSASPSKIKKSKSFSPTTTIPQQQQSPKRVPVHHSWSGPTTANSNNITTHYSNENNNSSVTTLASSLWSSPSITPDEKELLDMIEIMQPSASSKRIIGGNNNMYIQQQNNDSRIIMMDDKKLKKNISRTISSIGSDSSTRSSCSMIEDDGNDDEDEEEAIDYLTIKTISTASVNVMKKEDEILKKDNNIQESAAAAVQQTSPETLECIFKSMTGFEDEMQQQWKALITKYELLGDDNKITMIKNTDKNNSNNTSMI